MVTKLSTQANIWLWKKLKPGRKFNFRREVDLSRCLEGLYENLESNRVLGQFEQAKDPNDGEELHRISADHLPFNLDVTIMLICRVCADLLQAFEKFSYILHEISFITNVIPRIGIFYTIHHNSTFPHKVRARTLNVELRKCM